MYSNRTVTTIIFVTGFAKTLHVHTKTEIHFIAQDTLKNYPCTVSLLSSVNWSAFLEDILLTL